LNSGFLEDYLENDWLLFEEMDLKCGLEQLEKVMEAIK
jgi:hypothetical protein